MGLSKPETRSDYTYNIMAYFDCGVDQQLARTLLIYQ